MNCATKKLLQLLTLFLLAKFIFVHTTFNLLVQPVYYVYPFNRGVYEDTDITFTEMGGDVAFNDKIKFTLQPTCNQAVVLFDFLFTRDPSGAFNTKQLY